MYSFTRLRLRLQFGLQVESVVRGTQKTAGVAGAPGKEWDFYDVTISVRHPALYMWLELVGPPGYLPQPMARAHFRDNGFHMLERKKTVRFEPDHMFNEIEHMKGDDVMNYLVTFLTGTALNDLYVQ